MFVYSGTRGPNGVLSTKDPSLEQKTDMWKSQTQARYFWVISIQFS